MKNIIMLCLALGTPLGVYAQTVTTPEVQKPQPLSAVFDNYFAVKDALVKTDGKMASAKATDLLTALNTLF